MTTNNNNNNDILRMSTTHSMKDTAKKISRCIINFLKVWKLCKKTSKNIRKH